MFLFYLLFGVLFSYLVFYFVGCYFTEVYKPVVLYYPGAPQLLTGIMAALDTLVKAAVMAFQRLIGCSLWVNEREADGSC